MRTDKLEQRSKKLKILSGKKGGFAVSDKDLKEFVRKWDIDIGGFMDIFWISLISSNTTRQ